MFTILCWVLSAGCCWIGFADSFAFVLYVYLRLLPWGCACG